MKLLQILVNIYLQMLLPVLLVPRISPTRTGSTFFTGSGRLGAGPLSSMLTITQNNKHLFSDASSKIISEPLINNVNDSLITT